LANGGYDHAFFNEICKGIDNGPRVPPNHKGEMKFRLRGMFLLDEVTFIFWVPGMHKHSQPIERITPWSLARDTLELYQSEPPDGWKHEPCGMKRKVLNVLDTNNKVTIRKNIWLLEFTNTCSL
jgi:hypothetical protein